VRSVTRIKNLSELIGRPAPASDVDQGTYDLSVKNPDGGEEVTLRTPQEILDEIATLDAESNEILAQIRGLL